MWFLANGSWTNNFLLKRVGCMIFCLDSFERWVLSARWDRKIKILASKERNSKKTNNCLKTHSFEEGGFDKSLKRDLFLVEAFYLVLLAWSFQQDEKENRGEWSGWEEKWRGDGLSFIYSSKEKWRV